jgi:hypothetical protein
MMRRTGALVAAVMIACLVWYLHDPPWVGSVTSGMRQWEEDADGTRFRWTAGHATFFVPSSGAELTLPLRSRFPGRDGPVVVQVSVDDRWLADISLPSPSEWRVARLPLAARPGRRYRRVELRVNRVVAPYNLGVQVGEALVR